LRLALAIFAVLLCTLRLTAKYAKVFAKNAKQTDPLLGLSSILLPCWINDISPPNFDEREASMSRILLGTICGLVYGALSAASMIPLSFSDKRAALIGAFLNRFAIGFVIGASRLPVPSWAQGLILGVLLSLPDAIITKAFAPILILGAVGGTIIGLIVGKWGV
jgi:hypothetical protein